MHDSHAFEYIVKHHQQETQSITIYVSKILVLTSQKMEDFDSVSVWLENF